MIDVEPLRTTLVRELPERARWVLNGVTWDWDFSRAKAELQPLQAHEIVGLLPPECRDLLVFGTEDVAEGGGASPFVAVDRDVGAVVGIDLERVVPVYPLNSSLERFVATWRAFDVALRVGAAGRPGPGLTERLRAIDPLAFDASDWRSAALTVYSS